MSPISPGGGRYLLGALRFFSSTHAPQTLEQDMCPVLFADWYAAENRRSVFRLLFPTSLRLCLIFPQHAYIFPSHVPQPLSLPFFPSFSPLPSSLLPFLPSSVSMPRDSGLSCIASHPRPRLSRPCDARAPSSAPCVAAAVLPLTPRGKSPRPQSPAQVHSARRRSRTCSRMRLGRAAVPAAVPAAHSRHTHMHTRTAVHTRTVATTAITITTTTIIMARSRSHFRPHWVAQAVALSSTHRSRISLKTMRPPRWQRLATCERGCMTTWAMML